MGQWYYINKINKDDTIISITTLSCNSCYVFLYVSYSNCTDFYGTRISMNYYYCPIIVVTFIRNLYTNCVICYGTRMAMNHYVCPIIVVIFAHIFLLRFPPTIMGQGYL